MSKGQKLGVEIPVRWDEGPRSWLVVQAGEQEVLLASELGAPLGCLGVAEPPKQAVTP